jgi:hypothetical protein
MSRFREQVASATSRILGTLGETVTYTRDGESDTLLAVPSRASFETTNEAGSVIRVEARVYECAVSDLPFGLPVRGDVIAETIDGSVFSFEVLDQSGIGPYEYSDDGHAMIRVNTKRIENEES